jgi:hypothetical protein
MNAVGTKNIAFMPTLMSWTWEPASGRNPSDWWVPGIWDAYMVDHYVNKNSGSANPQDDRSWKNFVAWAEAKNIPYGLGEWGDFNSGAGTSNRMRGYWEWSFSNNKDMIAYAYFDSDLNGGKYMEGEQLATFHDILKNDRRVQRIDDLGQGGVTPPPTPQPQPNSDTIVSITSPVANSTVSGTVSVKVNASDNDGISSVNFRVNDKWYATDNTAPYEWNDWQTTNFADGTYQVIVRVRDTRGNLTEKSVNVVVKNNSENLGVLQPPQNLKASLGSFNLGNFTASKVPYDINLTWANASAYSYDIVRNGQFIGATATTSFTDKAGLQLGQTYFYEITSKDTKGNKSASSTASVNVACAIFWCTLQSQ